VRPEETLAVLARSEARLGQHLAQLGEADLAEPTALPGWSRAHVVAHLAANANALATALRRVGDGETPEQYPGGKTGREAEIEALAARPPDELVQEAIQASRRLGEAWDLLDAPAWETGRLLTLVGPVPVAEVPFRRLREVEVHVVDLCLGVEPEDWVPEYVLGELDRSLPLVGERLALGVQLRLEVVLPDGRRVETTAGAGGTAVTRSAPAATVVAWLVGRRQPEGWPVLGPWAPGPPDPAWRSETGAA